MTGAGSFRRLLDGPRNVLNDFDTFAPQRSPHAARPPDVPCAYRFHSWPVLPRARCSDCLNRCAETSPRIRSCRIQRFQPWAQAHCADAETPPARTMRIRCFQWPREWNLVLVAPTCNRCGQRNPRYNGVGKLRLTLWPLARRRTDERHPMYR